MKINSNLIKIILSVVLITIILYYVNPKKILGVIKGINPWFVLLTVFLIIATFLLFSLRIYSLTISVNKKINLMRIIKHCSLAFCLGSFSPARIGEVILVKSLKDEGVPLGSASAIFIIDRLISVLVTSLFSLLGFVFLIPLKENNLIIIFGIVVIFILFLGVTSKTGTKIIKKFLFRSITDKFEGFSKTLHSFKTDKFVFILINVLINIIHFLVRCSVIFVLFISLKEDVPFTILVGINAIVTLAAFIPISFSGLGVREGGAILLFSSLNYSTDKIAAAYLIATFLTYLLIAVMLPFLIDKKGVKRNYQNEPITR